MLTCWEACLTQILTRASFAGVVAVLPDTVGRLAAKTSRISACSLHADTSSTLNTDSEGNLQVCLVCRGTTLEILQIPSLEPLMSFYSASAGLPVMESSEGGVPCLLSTVTPCDALFQHNSDVLVQ